MVKAETTEEKNINDMVVLMGISVECKGTHEEIVHEVGQYLIA